MTKRGFYRFAHQYPVLPFEYAELYDGSRANNVLRQRKLYYRIFCCIQEHLVTVCPKICDIGCYPGSMLRLLHKLLPVDGITPSLHGVGLMTGDEFKRLMFEDCGVAIQEVNLDPRNPDLLDVGYPSQIPLADESMDIVIASEIIEHLMDPNILLGEASRILKRGGKLVLSTPNVTRIGSFFKLLVGRTNLDHLMSPGYTNTKDLWRPHFREYDWRDLKRLLTDHGFIECESSFFRENPSEVGITATFQRLINLCKLPFYVIPHFREHLLVMATKRSY